MKMFEGEKKPTTMRWIFHFLKNDYDQHQSQNIYCKLAYRLHPDMGFVFKSSIVKPYSPTVASPQAITNKMHIMNIRTGSNTIVNTAVWKERHTFYEKFMVGLFHRLYDHVCSNQNISEKPFSLKCVIHIKSFKTH